MEPWVNFGVAQVGASAALVGLVFVAVSINLAQIVASPRMPDRALGTLLALATVLAECSLLVAPLGSPGLAGSAILLVALAFGVAQAVVHRRLLRRTTRRHRRGDWWLVALTYLGLLAFLAAGGGALAGRAGGLSWLVPGVLLSYLVALIGAWVLLIEIKR